VLEAPLAGSLTAPSGGLAEHGLVGRAEDEVLHLLVGAACRPRHRTGVSERIFAAPDNADAPAPQPGDTLP